MACVTLKRSRDADALNSQRPIKRRRRDNVDTLGTHIAAGNGMEPKPSPFAASSMNKISPNTMDQNIRTEIQRLHKLKQLTSASSSESLHNADMMVDNCNTPRVAAAADKGLFNYKQVQLICQRMLQDQENKLREEYETVLSLKLAEQYDAFVKFTYDQIQRRFEATPSYLS